MAPRYNPPFRTNGTKYLRLLATHPRLRMCAARAGDESLCFVVMCGAVAREENDLASSLGGSFDEDGFGRHRRSLRGDPVLRVRANSDEHSEMKFEARIRDAAARSLALPLEDGVVALSEVRLPAPLAALFEPIANVPRGHPKPNTWNLL